MIKNVYLKNFKCFNEIEIPLNNLTLLAGSNGSGKSTIIQALLILAQSLNLNNSQRKINFMGKYIKLGYSNDVFYEYNEEKEFVMSIGLKSDMDVTSMFTAEYQSNEYLLECDVHGSPLESAKGLFSESFEYICADRISPEKVFSVFGTNKSLGIHGENIMSYISAFGNKPILDEMCSLDTENTLVTQIDFWLKKMFKGFSVKFEEVLKADTISLRFQEVSKNDRSNEHRPINVGFGITYVLPVIVALLKAKKDDLVIIENPECHLHPRAQRIIGELIAMVANAGVQVIIETHSDHVLNGIRVAVKEKKINKDKVQVLFADREDVGKHYHTNIYAPIIQDNGDFDVWPEGFFDEWDNALINLLG